MRVRRAFATADAFMTFSFHRESKVGLAESGNTEGECIMLISTPGGPKAPGREHGLPLLRSCGYSSPVPFRGSANVERVPRTFGNLLLVEAFVRYSCGQIVRRLADTPAAERARDPGSVDGTSDSAVESRVEPE